MSLLSRLFVGYGKSASRVLGCSVELFLQLWMEARGVRAMMEAGVDDGKAQTF